MLSHTDTLILGRVMYSTYEQYGPARLANPAAGSQTEVAYARLANKTPHIVISRTLDKVAWKTARIVRDVEEIRKMQWPPGKDMQVVGGAMLVSSLMNLGVIDELQLMVNPLILGGGKALFNDVKERHALTLIRAKPLQSGQVALTYSATLKDPTPTPEAVT